MKSYDELLHAFDLAVREYEFAHANYGLAQTHPKLQGELPELWARLLPIKQRMEDARSALEHYHDQVPAASERTLA